MREEQNQTIQLVADIDQHNRILTVGKDKSNVEYTPIAPYNRFYVQTKKKQTRNAIFAQQSKLIELSLKV